MHPTRRLLGPPGPPLLQEGGRHRLLPVHVPAEVGAGADSGPTPDQGPRGATPQVSEGPGDWGDQRVRFPGQALDGQWGTPGLVGDPGPPWDRAAGSELRRVESARGWGGSLRLVGEAWGSPGAFWGGGRLKDSAGHGSVPIKGAGAPPAAPLSRVSLWTRVPVSGTPALTTPPSRRARSTIRNAQSIHQRSRKRLSQDTYRRNSVRFLQQRRRLARPGPQSAENKTRECRTGRGQRRDQEEAGRRGGARLPSVQ